MYGKPTKKSVWAIIYKLKKKNIRKREVKKCTNKKSKKKRSNNTKRLRIHIHVCKKYFGREKK